MTARSLIDKFVLNEFYHGKAVPLLTRIVEKDANYLSDVRVLKLIPGRDGHVRLPLIKTEHSEFLRPVQRLFRLELDNPVGKAIDDVIHVSISTPVISTLSSTQAHLLPSTSLTAATVSVPQPPIPTPNNALYTTDNIFTPITASPTISPSSSNSSNHNLLLALQ
ncbi:hypothetical protein TNCV_1143761 [Trichonephila clavipes]|nr:hypothetical protein TNCV_1143761 [Trichonephila clavipes]